MTILPEAAVPARIGGDRENLTTVLYSDYTEIVVMFIENDLKTSKS